MAESPLIPRYALFGPQSSMAQVKLSPDGKYLAYVGPVHRIPNLLVQSVDDAEKGLSTLSPITFDMVPPGVTKFSWTFMEGILIYTQDMAGNENHRLYKVNAFTKERRLLAGARGMKVKIEATHYRFPDTVIVGMNNRDKRLFDLYAINITTGRSSLFFVNRPGFSKFVFDQNLQLSLAAKQNPDGATVFYRFRADPLTGLNTWEKYRQGITHKLDEQFVKHEVSEFSMEWYPNVELSGACGGELSAQPHALDSSTFGFHSIENSDTSCFTNCSSNLYVYPQVPFDDELTTKPMRFDAANQNLYWTDSTRSDKSRLILTNFENQNIISTVYVPEKSDVGPVLWHPVTHKPLAVTDDYTKPRWVVLDESVRGDIEYLENRDPNSYAFILGGSLSFRKWVIMQIRDNEAPTFFLYNRDTKELHFLFAVNKDIEKFKLSRMHSEEIPTKDGLIQVCYISLPAKSDPTGSGRPNKPVPMVLRVHGGPWMRDLWGFDPETQLLTNRGYAVLQCNFRGSKGYGKSFINAGNGEWGRKMHQDLLDAVNWAVGQGIADPERVAIYGGSYGGYAALAGLAFTPDKFACGVAISGPSNLITLLKATPPTWRPYYNSMRKRMGGDPDTEEGRKFLASRSPFFYASNIKKPLLIAQGSNDPRVPKRESDQIFQALSSQGVPVTYLVFPGEGHGLRHGRNKVAHLTETEQFLAECLGGRAEPQKGDSVGTSMQKYEAGKTRNQDGRTFWFL